MQFPLERRANVRSQPLFQYSPCAAWHSLNPVLNRHAQHLPSVTTPLFSLWYLGLICSTPASSDPPHSAHWHTAGSCQPLLPTVSESNWVKEIHFGFFFFSGLLSEAVVMVMGYKDESASQCTHGWEINRVYVCDGECACVHVCVLPTACHEVTWGWFVRKQLNWMAVLLPADQNID